MRAFIFYGYNSFAANQELMLGGKNKKMAMKNLKGQSAIPFKLTDSNERTIFFESYKGGWLLLVFHRHLG